MAAKLVVLSVLLAAANAGVISAPTVLAPGAPLGRTLVGQVPLGLAAPQLAVGPQLAVAPRLAVAPQLALAQQQILAAPIAKAAVAAVDTDYDPNPSYSYAYDIQDALTGDSKNQQESRQGDVVQGSYSLTEPDGTRRTVEYTADPINGFNAVVHRQPLAVPVAKTVVAAPAIAHSIAAPAIAHGIAAPALASPLALGRIATPLGAPLGAHLAAPLGAQISPLGLGLGARIASPLALSSPILG